MRRIITVAAIAAVIAASVFVYFIFATPCLIIRNADTGEIVSQYPASSGDRFSVTFIHSVNKSPVTDVYEIRKDGIYVIQTKYYSFGAGVQTEIEDGQTLEYGEDGSMIVSGFNKKMDNLSYIVGTVSDHILEISGQTISLRDLCGRNATIRFSYERRLML
jgi:hypothetical protein